MRSVRFALLLVALFILSGLVSIPKGYAVCDGTWTGAAGDGKWETAGNWSASCVPDHDATIPNGAFVVTISTPQTLTGSVTVGQGDTLKCTSTCTLTAVNFYNTGTGTPMSGGTLINFGTVFLSGNFQNDAGGIVSNFGSVTVSGNFYDDSHGTVTNSGTISISGNFYNDSHGTLTNSGIVSVSGNFFNDAGGTVTNSGTVTISGSIFTNDAGTFIDECQGTVNKAPTSGNPVETLPCPVVGGELLPLDYGSMALSVAPWLLIIAALAAAAAITLRQKRNGK